MAFSMHFDNIVNRDIGLYFIKRYLSLLLKGRNTSAIFITSGKIPSLKHLLHISVSIPFKIGASFFSIILLIISWALLFFDTRERMIFNILGSVTLYKQIELSLTWIFLSKSVCEMVDIGIFLASPWPMEEKYKQNWLLMSKLL